MKNISFTKTEKLKAIKKAKRNADIELNLQNRTMSYIFENKKKYNRKNYKLEII